MTTHFRIRKAFVAMLLAYFALPLFVLAANDYVALTTIPSAIEGCAPNGYDKDNNPIYTQTTIKTPQGNITKINNCDFTDPVKVITNIYGVSIGIAAILAVGMIIWAGIEYATVESIQGHSDAKDRWQGAIFGLLLLLSSYLILRTINIDLVNINLDLGTPKIGERVGENALQGMIDTANNSSAEYQKALSDVQIAQKNLSDAKATGDAAVIAAATTVFNNADLDAKTLAFSAAINQGNLQVGQAIKNGDLEAAKVQIGAVDTKLQEDIDDLQLSKANPDKITQAKIEKISTVGLLNQEVYIADNIEKIQQDNLAVRATHADSANNILIKPYTIDTDARGQRMIIEARQGIARQFNANAVEIRKIDPAGLVAYSQRTNAQLQAFDRQMAQTVGCAGGISVTSTSVTCKN